MAESTTESTISIVKETILGFLNYLQKDKRRVEQEIRERVDSIFNTFISSGVTQISFNDIQDLSNSYRKEFIDYYRNTIHMTIIATASYYIRDALERGYMESGIIQQEWIQKYDQLQKQIEELEIIKTKLAEANNKIKEYENKLLQADTNQKVSSKDIEAFQKALKERDEMIILRDRLLDEKEQEIINLTEGLSRMEEQTNQLGQTILSHSMNIEDLQEALNEKDEKIKQLQASLNNSETNNERPIVLRQQLTNAEMKIRELESQLSVASGELVTKLQEDLEHSRAQIIELKKEIVEKNDKLHNYQFEHEELVTNAKNANARLAALEERLKEIETQKEHADKEIAELHAQVKLLTEEKDENLAKITMLESELGRLNSEYKLASGKIKETEGKITVDEDEQRRITRRVKELEELLEENKKAYKFIEDFVEKDLKFKILFFLNSINQKVKLDDIAQAIDEQVPIVQKAVIELAHSELIVTQKKGRSIFVEIPNTFETPFALKQE